MPSPFFLQKIPPLAMAKRFGFVTSKHIVPKGFMLLSAFLLHISDDKVDCIVVL